MVEFEFECNDKLEFEFLLASCRVAPASALISAAISAPLRTILVGTSEVHNATIKEA